MSTYRIYLGLARTAHIHLIWPYVWWSPCQKYRKYTVLVLASPKETLWKEEGGSLPGATVDCMCSLCGCTLYNLAHFVSLLLLYKPTFTYVCSVWVWPTLCVCVLCMSVTHFVRTCTLYECDPLCAYVCSVWVWPTLCLCVLCMSVTYLVSTCALYECDPLCAYLYTVWVWPACMSMAYLCTLAGLAEIICICHLWLYT
jgi:hypothetical protein